MMYFKPILHKSLWLVVPYFLMAASTHLSSRVPSRLFYPLYFVWLMMAFPVSVRLDRRLSGLFWWIVGLLIPAVLVMYIYGGLGRDTPLRTNLGLAGLSVFLFFVVHYVCVVGCLREMRWLFWVCIFLLCISSITMSQYDMGVTRVLATGWSDDTYEQLHDRIDMMQSGALNFGTSYGLVFLSLAFLGFFKRFPKKVRWVVMGIQIILLYGLYRASYSTAILCLFIGVQFILLSKLIHSMRIFSVLGFILVILIVTIMSEPSVLKPFSGIPLFIAEKLPDNASDYKTRIKSVAFTMQGEKDVYANERFELHRESVRAFLRHPILGATLAERSMARNEKSIIGGHSTTFDALGRGGLLLFVPLFVAMYLFVKYVKLMYQRYGCVRDLRTWYCLYYTFLVLSCINPVTFSEMLVAFFFWSTLMPILFARQGWEAWPHVAPMRGYMR